MAPDQSETPQARSFVVEILLLLILSNRERSVGLIPEGLGGLDLDINLLSEIIESSSDIKELLEQLEKRLSEAPEIVAIADIGEHEMSKLRRRVVADLESIPNLELVSEDHRTLVLRNATRRQQLAKEYPLLDLREFALLASGSINPKNPNLSRTLGRKRDVGEILALKLAGKMQYPVILINPRTNSPYPELKPLIRRARLCDYNDWEIFEWLVSPRALTSPQVEIPREPFKYTSMDDLLYQIEGIPERVDDGVPRILPIDLLIQRRTEEFQHIQDVWLKTHE